MPRRDRAMIPITTMAIANKRRVRRATRGFDVVSIFDERKKEKS
jgi:hypothetical protein